MGLPSFMLKKWQMWYTGGECAKQVLKTRFYFNHFTHCSGTGTQGSQEFIPNCLSSDPDKNYSIFYCSVAISFPHIEMVMFSDQEFINRWKAGL